MVISKVILSLTQLLQLIYKNLVKMDKKILNVFKRNRKMLICS